MSRVTSNTQLTDPRVPLLRAQLQKAQQDALKWSEACAQWRASAERRHARELEQATKTQELQRELEETRKRQREENQELEHKLEGLQKRVASAVMKVFSEQGGDEEGLTEP